MWIQLLTRRNIEIAGETRTFHPGDWVDIGKHLAMQMIARGEARAIEAELSAAVSGGGVVFYRSAPVSLGPGLPYVEGSPSVPYEKTLIWDTSLALSTDLIIVGLSLLDTWEMAAPIASQDKLALHLGTEEERERTREVIRDLRVPYYDTRAIFVRRTPLTERMIAYWQRQEGDEHLAFLRALYLYKPMLCALPVTWAGISL